MDDWIRDVFIVRAHLFQLALERMRERGEREAEGLARLLERHGVPKGGEVLELGCGTGRVAVPLAARGYRVACLDISRVFLEEASRRAAEAGLKDRVEVVEGDAWRVDELFPADRFDAVYMIWTTLIGYHLDKARDLELLERTKRVTRPGGVLAILKTASRDQVVARRSCQGGDVPIVSEWEDLVVVEHPEFDGIRSLLRNRWEYYRRSGRNLEFLGEHEFTLRIYTITELVELAEEAGWTLEAAYHRLDTLEPYKPGRSGINIVLRKPPQ
ncbi:MAG: class I SAM-dependent methyltransferase [Desulfurococcales archaeon]|nr:class I SAM-dependent methyltransferase [Desulfurococcales archaeon]